MKKNPHRLDDLIEFNATAAACFLEAKGSCLPFVIAEDGHGNMFYVHVRIESDRSEMQALLEAIFFAYKVIRYVFVSEAWVSMISVKEHEQLSHELDELLKHRD